MRPCQVCISAAIFYCMLTALITTRQAGPHAAGTWVLPSSEQASVTKQEFYETLSCKCLVESALLHTLLGSHDLR